MGRTPSPSAPSWVGSATFIAACRRSPARFVIAVGHGQFFRAYLWGREQDFAVAPKWMKEYRAAETAQPMANGEIIELKGSDRP